MEQVAIRYEGDGMSWVVGKILSEGNVQVFFMTAKARDLLRVYDSFSIAPEVLALLERVMHFGP